MPQGYDDSYTPRRTITSGKGAAGSHEYQSVFADSLPRGAAVAPG